VVYQPMGSIETVQADRVSDTLHLCPHATLSTPRTTATCHHHQDGYGQQEHTNVPEFFFHVCKYTIIIPNYKICLAL
jgi:hypothetical protein